MLTHLIDVAQGKTDLGNKRSSKWPTTRKRHLAMYPACAVCGGTDKVEVHHKKPFHLQPDLELELTNLITLCEGTKFINCHLAIGHGGNFRAYNPSVESDAERMRQLIAGRATE